MKTIICSVVLSVVMISFAFGSGTGDSDTEAMGEPIHIGIIGPMTGWATVYGQNVARGVQMALAEVDDRFNDRPIKLFIEDTKAEVEVMLTKLDSLVQRDGCEIIIGPSLGHEGDALPAWAEKNPDVTVMVGYSGPQDMTMRDNQPNVIRAGFTANQVIFHFGQFAAQDLGYDKIVMVGQDYAYPWGQAAGFKRGFFDNGGEEVKTIWHPVEMLDFSSVMAELQNISSDYDAVFYNGSGAQVLAFWKAWEQFGMDRMYPQLLGGANVPDVPLLSQLGDGFVGVYSSMHYTDGDTNPDNTRFRTTYFDQYKEYPDAIVLQGYDSMRVLLRALETGASIEDTEALRQAILAVKIDDSPRGSFSFDTYGHAVQNVYIKRVAEVDGEFMNVTVKSYEQQSQFGPYDRYQDEYMSTPPDARDYPSDIAEEYFTDLVRYFGEEYVADLRRNGGWR